MGQNSKSLIKGMSLDELQNWCEKIGETRYRGIQLYGWLYKRRISNPQDMTDLSLRFRNYLTDHTELNTIFLDSKMSSNSENTIKYLFTLADGKQVETVSMVDGYRHTVCISSQVGCSLECDFCATAKMGLLRNLKTGEIVDQLLYVQNNVDEPVTNVVFMGMGEPFLNYDRVLKAADIFHDPRGLNMGASRITISTVGLLPKIEQFINEKRKYKLTISLNAADDLTRNKIMPINKKWDIREIIKAGKEFSKMKRRQIMFEYVLLKGINDSAEDAKKLSELLVNVECKLNIIPYNETDGEYMRPDENTINEFINILHDRKKKNGYRVLVRWSKGQDIAAGCGQLAVN